MDLVNALFQIMLMVFSGKAHPSLKKKLLIDSGGYLKSVQKKIHSITFIRFWKWMSHSIMQKKILLHQQSYVDSIDAKELDKNAGKDRKLSAREKSSFRSIVGQLNWVGSQTRPDIAFKVCQLSTRLNSGIVRDILGQ